MEYKPLVETLVTQLLIVAVEKRIDINFYLQGSLKSVIIAFRPEARKIIESLQLISKNFNQSQSQSLSNKVGSEFLTELEKVKKHFDEFIGEKATPPSAESPESNNNNTQRFSFFESRLTTMPSPLELIKELQKPPQLEAKIKNSLNIQLRQIFLVILEERSKTISLHILLSCACITGNVAVARELIKKNADVDKIIIDFLDNKTPLHLASQYGHNELVKLLINNSKKKFLDEASMNLLDKDKNTPLHIAVQFCQYEVVNTLADVVGLKIESKNSDKETALGMAIKQNNPCVKILLGTPQRISQARSILSLNWLVQNNAWEVLCLLYKEGPPSQYQVNCVEEGFTLIHSAVSHNNTEMVRYLVNVPGAECDVTMPGLGTPLECAIDSSAHNEIVTLLAKKTENKSIFEAQNLFENAILNQNFSLLRVIENRTPQLLPNHFKSKNDKVNYISIIKATLDEFKDSMRIWGGDVESLPVVLIKLFEDFKIKNSSPDVDQLLQAALSYASDEPVNIEGLVILYMKQREEAKRPKKYLAIARSQETRPGYGTIGSIHNNDDDERRKFLKLLQFVVFKFMLIKTALSFDDLRSDEYLDIVPLLSGTDIKIIDYVRRLIDAPLLINLANNNNNNDYDNNNVTSRMTI
ncbi:MAG: ankyrin repeat domain-containing protein [Gammaproteobacteria bacterium]|nr:ankyrin repeat domain-containing protein [Gammaproteobacteria bacterium]